MANPKIIYVHTRRGQRDMQKVTRELLIFSLLLRGIYNESLSSKVIFGAKWLSHEMNW